MCMLLQVGADINDRTLTAATKTADIKTSQWLLHHSADPHNSRVLESVLNTPLA